MAICPNCGGHVSDGAGFCSTCGVQMAVQYHPPHIPIQPPKKDNTVVIVVIVVVIVLLLVVLGPVLYVMVIGMGGDTGIETPLGLNQQSRTTSTVTILISSAPNGALIDGTQISLTSGGTPTAIISVTLYSAAAVPVGIYSPATGTWSVGTNEEFQAGMTIVITAPGITNGDVLTFSSIEEYFGTTTLTVY